MINSKSLTTVKYVIFVTSYIALSAYKSLNYVLSGDKSTAVIAASFVTWILFALFSYLGWKGMNVFRYLTSLQLGLVGLSLLPCFIAPAIPSIWMRLLGGSIGAFWIFAAVWIFRAYPYGRTKLKKNE